ncbi:MAG TPA: hypothetical protein VF590_28255 [Isosphaeraceae bacterium]|jgi:hypothetical protein
MPLPSDLPILNPEFPGDGRRQTGLPIIRVDETRKTQAEKYGGLYYLGIAGLFVLVGLIGWFAYGVWSLRDVGQRIYVLHDPSRPEAERIQAAFALSRDPRVTQRQLWDICARERGLPPLARYLIAEALTAEAAATDPRGFALAIARSEGWPNWLRLLLLRPLAYRAAAGGAIAPEPLAELRRHPDPMIDLWAAFTQAAALLDEDSARRDLEQAAGAEGPLGEQARSLLAALEARGDERTRDLDRASHRLRRGHPEAARLWDGWGVQGDHLAHPPALDLLEPPPGPPGTTSATAAEH